MDEKQYKRMVRMFTIMWFVVLFLLLYLLFKAPSTEVHNYVGERGEKGEQGIQGLKGETGIPGKTVTTRVERETVVEKAVPLEGKPGKKGDTGEQGEPGRTPVLRTNPETGDIEWKYEADMFWQVLVPACQLTSEGCEE